MQMSSLFGVYGLSFWVFLTNLCALRLLSHLSVANGAVWGGAVIVPYLFGLAHLAVHSEKMLKDPTPLLSALLVQTSLSPAEKFPYNGSIPLHPLDQWEHICKLLASHAGQSEPEVVVFSEGVVPYGTDMPIYHHEPAQQILKRYFPEADLAEVDRQTVSNRFWAQSLADAMKAPVIIGLEDVDTRSQN